MASVKLNSNGLNNNNNNHSSSSSSAGGGSSRASSSRSSNNSSPSLAGSGSNSPAAAAECQMDTSTNGNECDGGSGNANPQSTVDLLTTTTTTLSSSSSAVGGIEWIGSACGHYGPYTFYKAVKLSRPRRRILAMGDFFLVKPWSDQEIVSIGEIQLLWEDDKASPTNGHRTPLVSIKLYFLPENTPEGRHEEHGEDEVVSISEKVVLKVADLATWIVDDVKWERGSPSVWDRQCSSSPTGSTAPRSPRTPTTPPKEGAAAAEEAETAQNAASPPVATATAAIAAVGPLDMCDVMKEKRVIAIDDESSWNVLVLSYPAYCRYRSTLKRLEGHSHTEYMRQAVVEAIGGRAAPTPNTRVVFCKDTFDYPELEDHELLCNHLAPKWKGRPRKMRKKRSHSPGSESNESESSVSTGTSSYRSSPMKPHGIRNVPAPYRPGDRPKGEQIFMQKLNKFMAGRGTPIGRLPSLGFKQLDLFLFYVKVQRAGGYEAAVANKLWKGIYMELGGHPSNTSAATCTRRHYEKLLLPYERHVEEISSSNTSPATAAAATTTTGGGSGSGGSGTPPKKRKLSSTIDVFADLEERLRAEASSSNLTLQELMTAGDPANLLAAATSDSKALSALSDLARIAHQLDGNRPSVIQKNVIEAHKSHMGSSSGAGSNGTAAHSKSMAHSMSASSTSLGPPPPAHSQKPVTLPSVNAAAAAGAGSASELCQWYTQMLSDGTSKSNGGNPLGATAVLELALRPPTPAAATPSIFVPSRRIYVDPTLDVKKTRLSSGSSPAVHNPSSGGGGGGGSIQSAHASRPTNSKIPGLNPIGPSSSSFHSVTPPRPVAASAPSAAHQLNHSAPSRTAAHQSHMLPSPATSHRSSIPLVDLTSRSVNPIKSESESSLTGKTKQELINGKSLMDLSAQPLHHNHNHHKFSSGSTGVSSLHTGTAKPWNSSRDVSISLNVKIEGSGAEAPSTGYKSSGVMGNSSSHLHQQQQQQQRNSHSVTVVPLVKEDLSSIQQLARRKEKEAMRADRISVTAQHHHSSSSSSSHSQQQQQQQQQAYPRMVDSLVAINNASSAAAGVSSTKSGSIFTSASHYGGSSSSSGSKSVSTSSSSSTAAAVAAAAAASSGLQHAPMYAGMLDPALASYYSSLYAAPHMYGLPPGAFMTAASGAPGMHHSSMFHPNHHHHGQHQMGSSSAAAEVTAQVYKEMVQRGYPPALAPGLPPGLSGLPGLSSLGSFAASMYSSLGGAAKADHANTAERSLPKS